MSIIAAVVVDGAMGRRVCPCFQSSLSVTSTLRHTLCPRILEPSECQIDPCLPTDSMRLQPRLFWNLQHFRDAASACVASVSRHNSSSVCQGCTSCFQQSWHGGHIITCRPATSTQVWEGWGPIAIFGHASHQRPCHMLTPDNTSSCLFSAATNRQAWVTQAEHGLLRPHQHVVGQLDAGRHYCVLCYCCIGC